MSDTTMKEALLSGNEYVAEATIEAFEGTADAVSWANVTGKPDEFTPEAHNHASDAWLLSIIDPLNLHVADSDLHVTADILLKIAGIAENANNYTHPTNHPASIITQDEDNRFVTDIEKAAWDAKAETSYVDSAVAALSNALVGAAPETLDTIVEIAAALQDNPDVITEMLTSIGLKASQADFDSHTGDTSLHVTQTILDKITGIESGATADQTGQEISDLLDALFGDTVWRTDQSAEVMLTADPTNYVKATTESFANAFANAVTALSTYNAGGRNIVIQLADGTHTMGDDVFDLVGHYNGRVSIEAQNAISSAGINQNAILQMSGSGYMKMLNCNLNIDISCIKVELTATNHLIPFNIDGNAVISTHLCCWDFTNADAEATVFFLAGCKLTSCEDTFIGSATQITNFVKFARGGDDAKGGEVYIFNAHYSTTMFTNAVNGKGVVSFGNSDAIFTNKTANGAIDVSANDGAGTVSVPAMTSGAVSNVGETTADFTAEFNRAGTIYYAVLPTASAVPTVAEIIAGTGATASGTISTAGLTTETESITGLTAETAYDLYYFGRDALNNDTPIYVSSEFTTDAAAATEGPEMLTDGSNLSDTNWDIVNGWSFSTPDAVYDGVTSNGSLYQPEEHMVTPMVASTTYVLRFDLSDTTDLQLRIRNYSGTDETLVAQTSYGSGSHEVQFTTSATLDGGGLRLYTSSTGDGAIISNISLKEVL